MLTTHEEDINITTISSITQRCSTHAKSHCLVSPLLSNSSRRYTSLIFSIRLFPVESPRVGFQYHHKRDFILFDRVSTTSLYTNPLWPQIPCVYIPPTSHIYNTTVWIRIYNPIGGLVELFCRNSQRV